MPRQSDLRYTFEPLRGDPFEVVSFILEEGLSQPFKLDLELVSHHPAIDFYRMLDLAAVFTIWRDDTPVRYVHGLGTIGTHTDCRVIYQPMGGGDALEPALNRLFESSISEAKEFHQKIAGSYHPHTYVYYGSEDKPQPRVHHLENDAWCKRQQAPRFTPRKLWDVTLKSVRMRYGAVAPKPDPRANIRGPRAEEVAGSERILDGAVASFAQREPCPWTGR